MLPAAALAHDGQHSLAEPVGLTPVRVPGQDELGDAERGVLLDPVGDLDVAADQRRARASAQRWPGRWCASLACCCPIDVLMTAIVILSQ
jgi:hypothetical protein